MHHSLALTLVFLLCASRVAMATPFLEKTNLFEEGKEGFASYRIPGIIVTAKGSVLAYCEARKYSGADEGEIEIHLRRSTDGGNRFTEGFFIWSDDAEVKHAKVAHNPRRGANIKRVARAHQHNAQTFQIGSGSLLQSTLIVCEVPSSGTFAQEVAYIPVRSKRATWRSE